MSGFKFPTAFTILFCLIIIVAAFNIISSMIMLVKDKGRDIAILRTMGATRGTIMRIFFMSGATIGVVGTIAGFLLGVAFAANIETIRQLLQGLTGTDLFAADAQVYFPKWGVASGKEEIGNLFGDVGGTLKSITHHFAEFNWVFSGSDVLVCEGTSHGEHQDGPWRAGVPDWAAGRWCDVFEIRDFLIQRVFIYLDPDYAGKDTARYPWLDGEVAG